MKSEGICEFCRKTISGRAMSRHLQSCAERTRANDSEEGEERVYLLKASADPFWVYFEVNASLTLKEVDSFLRDLWLECCGHLSAFTIGATRYPSYSEREYWEKSMNVVLKNVLRPGFDFFHEYDFGTTTELDMKCISERVGKLSGINILARNNIPEFKCDKCGRPAKVVCTDCIWNTDEGLLCDSCAETHKCGEEMLLSVVNSPRMGMCAYTGEF